MIAAVLLVVCRSVCIEHLDVILTNGATGAPLPHVLGRVGIVGYTDDCCRSGKLIHDALVAHGEARREPPRQRTELPCLARYRKRGTIYLTISTTTLKVKTA